MRTTLRLAVLLLTLVVLVPSVAWAVPVAQPKTATTGTQNQLYAIPGFSATLDAGQSVSSYRFESVPANTIGLIGYPTNTNGTTTNGYTAAGNGTVITAAQAAGLVFQPSGTYTGQTTFNYTVLQSNNVRSANALYTINLVPTATAQTAVIMSNTNPQTSIPALAVSGTVAPSKYRILALPSAAAGVLYVNGVAATANQDITTTQAGQLTFDPAAGYYGNAVFTYAALDANNNVSPSAQYSLPVTTAGCGQAGAIDFSRRTIGEDWKATSATVNGTTITTSGYSTSVTGTNTNTFAVANNATLPGPALVWQQNNIGNNPTTVPNVAQVTFTFSRPVNGLSIAISDIDRDVTNANFTDEVVFNGYSSAGSNTPIALASANVALGSNNTNTYAGSNTVQGTNVNTSDAAGTVVVTFPSAVQRVTLIYRNTAAYVNNTTDRTQTIGIPSMTWCSQADVTTTIGAQTSPVTAGTQGQFNVTFANNGVDVTAQGVVAQVQLPAGLTNVVASNGGSYNTNTGLVTYPGITTLTVNQTQSSTITFTAPGTGPVNATASISTTTDEGTNTAPNSAATSIAVTTVPISGRVFEDVNYGGGAGRSFATANTSATGSGFANNAILRSGATVELYNSSGALVGTTTTDATGAYTFNAPAAGNYTVRVVNSTVTSARTGYVNTLVPVQTFVNGNVNRVGGEAPEKQDAAANSGSQTLAALTAGTATPQSITTVAATTSGVTNVDFGFNFDVIVNTNNAGQGSLRQFLLNSNALGGENQLAQAGSNAAGTLPTGVETSIFMIPNGTARPGLLASNNGGPASQLTNGAAFVAVSSALPSISGANATNTSLDGSTQTANIGNTNAAVTTTGSESTGPEVVINFATTDGFATTAANTRVIGLGFTNANNNAGSGSAALRVDAGANNAIIQNNTFYDNGANFRLNNVSGATVTGNISRNALANNSDGIEMTASSNNTITGNQFLANAGYGIDFISGQSNGNNISGNVFARNGQNTSNGQSAGIGLRDGSSNNTISGNTFTANVGDGISANNGSNNVFTQNSFSANGNLGIDLTTATNNDGDGVTLNDAGDVDAGTAQANGLINFPVITAATIRNGNLVVEGFARPGVTVELYVADQDATGFGEGQTFFNSFVEGSAADINAGTGSYSGLINGRNQGTDNTNRFTVSIPLANLTPAQRTALTTAGAQLTALSTLTTNTGGNYGTSEFSGNAPVLQAPVANNDQAVTAPGTAVTLNVAGNDQNSIDAATINLAGQGIGNNYTVAGQGTFTWASNGQITFTPVAGFTGIVTIPYTINNTSGTTSNTAFITVEVRNPNADLQASITGPANNTAVNAGASQTFTVVATNNTAGVTATDVVETLQLPAGLTSNGGTVTIGGGANAAAATYNNTTGLVTIPVGTLANGSPQTYTVTVSTMPGSGPITATANISGAITETNTTNNSAAVTVTINPRYDVATTISGPTTGVVRGNEVTYTVTTSNLSTTPGSVSTATNVVQTVQLPANLTGVFASNGGTYDASSGVVTFPTIGTLPVGQTVVNSISFAAPTTGTSFTSPTATVTANSNNTGDLNTANNSAFLNGATAAGTVTTTAPTGTPAAPGTAQTGTVANVYTGVTASATNVAPGAPVTLTVTTSNAGPNPASTVAQTLLLPAGLTGVTVTNGTYAPATGLVTFTSIGTLNPAATNTTGGNNLPFAVTFNAPAQGFVLATATVTSATTDVIPADNLAQVKVEVNPVADLATVLAGPTTASTGQQVTYTVTTTNNGGETAVGTVQRVTLPAGLTGVTVSNGGSYDQNTGIVTFAIGSLAQGQLQTNSISYTVPAGATNFTATANVSSSTPETVLTNNVATVATAVLASSDVTVAVSGPATALVGSPAVYAVTTTNNGPSPASSVVPTLQLPAGLTNNGTVTVYGGGSYDNATGLVTFSTVALPSGGSVSNSVIVTVPDVAQINGVARVSSAAAETNYDNNFASVVTTINPATTTVANLGTTISASATSVAPNASVTVTANFSNAAGAGTASGVVPTLYLPAGLANNGNTVTVAGGTGGSYNNTTGVVTWNSPGDLAGGASLPANTYRVTFVAPSSGAITATSAITSSTSDSAPANNIASTTITVNPSANVSTSISGPATTQPGATVTYAVLTLNNGVSPASSTQAVTLPAGATNITYSGANGPVSVANGTTTITFPAISNQVVGAAGQVTNYVSFTAPSADFTVTANLTPGSTTGDVTTDNTASVTTRINRAPVAYNVVNNLQTPEANTAGPLSISPLVATDADGNTLTYRITALPATAAGTLLLNSTAVTVNQVLSATEINQLRFDPAAGFIGNAFFSYTATDNATTPATSNTAIYTIAVGQDANSVYTSTVKGGSNATAYQNGDLIAAVTDANAVRYNSSGVAYDYAAVNGNGSTGQLVGADNGVRSATTDAAGNATLSLLGLTLDPVTGEIRVQDRTRLALRSGAYSLNVTTVDANGGTNTQVVNFTIGFGPLPVTLVEFGVKAQSSDAQLAWTTAQEKDNDHFDVERSIDGVRFEKVGEVAGHGTVTNTQHYRFTDANAARLGTLVYYRLRQVDYNGTESYSAIKSVGFGKQTTVELTLFPNPATDVLNVRLTGPATQAAVTVYNAAGALVLKGQLDSSLSTVLNVQALPAGTYLVKVQAANGLPLTRRFVKY